jgi:hypothetical protein
MVVDTDFEAEVGREGGCALQISSAPAKLNSCKRVRRILKLQQVVVILTQRKSVDSSTNSLKVPEAAGNHSGSSNHTAQAS